MPIADRSEPPSSGSGGPASERGSGLHRSGRGRHSALDNVPGGDANPLVKFEKARRHSNRVRFMKRALPAAGLVIILAIVGALLAARSSLPSIDLGPIRMVGHELVMDNPQLKGVDSRQRPYSLSAERAVQDADRPTMILLERIEARLPISDQSFAKVSAGRGIYDADSKTLSLDGKIAVDTQDGLRIRMEDAEIDIEAGYLTTLRPVRVESGRNAVQADSMTVEKSGKTIIFEKRVRMTIVPPAPKDVAARAAPVAAPADAAAVETDRIE